MKYHIKQKIRIELFQVVLNTTASFSEADIPKG